MMDFEAAARMSGARFVVLKGQLARLERALTQFMLDMQTEQNGYVEHATPLLVRTGCDVWNRSAAEVPRRPVRDQHQKSISPTMNSMIFRRQISGM